VSYKVDPESGALLVDRFLLTPMPYPVAYGFVPGTLTDDGDPADALVLVPAPVVPGAVLRARPIGMLMMEDEAGLGEKIICVPHDCVHPQYSLIDSIDDLPGTIRAGVEHFFERCKTLEKDEWLRITGWASKSAAEAAIVRSMWRVCGVRAKAAE